MTTDPIYIAVVANLDDDGYSRRKSGDWQALIGRDRAELIERVTGMAYKYNKESRTTRYKAYVGMLTEEVTMHSVASARWSKAAPPKPEPVVNKPIPYVEANDDDIPF